MLLELKIVLNLFLVFFLKGIFWRTCVIVSVHSPFVLLELSLHSKSTEKIKILSFKSFSSNMSLPFINLS